MDTPQTEADLDRLIRDGIEESLTLEYKAAGALIKADPQRKEITKDVSAMANSAGGVIIYGIRESSNPTRKHKPEAIDPINRTAFSKEWLEQIINLIRPKLDVRIYPITINASANDVAYAVEIPQSDTAHQATDLKYDKRFNFLAEAMADYEIRDIMGRAKSAAFEIQTELKISLTPAPQIQYRLHARLHNVGKITAYDVSMTIISPKETHNVEPSLWDWKRGSRHPTFISKLPIHPGSDQVIGFWSLGVGTILSSERSWFNIPQEQLLQLPASFDGPEVRITLHASAKDQSQVTAVIEYSKAEIEARTLKQFRCSTM